MNPTAPISRERSAFRHPPFRWYFAGCVVSFLGTWFERIALGWYTWELTQSAFWTGLVAMALMLPTGLLGPFIGVYVDRWSARMLSIVLNLLMAAISVGFFLLSMNPETTILPVAMLAVGLGLIGAWYHPVRLLLVSEVVPRQYLTSGIGLVAVAFNGSRMVGPAIAGIIIFSFGLPPAFLLNALSYLPMVAVLAVIPLVRRPAPARHGRLLSELGDGLRYALASPVIRWSLLSVLVSGVAGRGVLEIMPAIAGSILSGGSAELAVLTSTAGAGALVASVLVGVMSPSMARMQSWSRWLLPASTFAAIFAGAGGGLWVVAGVIGFTAFASTTISVAAQSTVQIVGPDHYRARLLTWWSTGNFGGTTAGALLLGYFGDLVPLGLAIAILSGLGLACAGWLAMRSPRPDAEPPPSG